MQKSFRVFKGKMYAGEVIKADYLSLTNMNGIDVFKRENKNKASTGEREGPAPTGRQLLCTPLIISRQ